MEEEKHTCEKIHALTSLHPPPLPSFLPPSLPPSASTVRITYTRQASVDEGLSALKQACHYPIPPPSLPPSPPPQGWTGTEGRREGGREGGWPDFVDAVLFREKGKKVGEVAGASQVGVCGREGGKGGTLDEGFQYTHLPSPCFPPSLPPSLPPPSSAHRRGRLRLHRRWSSSRSSSSSRARGRALPPHLSRRHQSRR